MRHRLFDLSLDRQRVNATMHIVLMIVAIPDQRGRCRRCQKLLAAELKQLAIVCRSVHREDVAQCERYGKCSLCLTAREPTR